MPRELGLARAVNRQTQQSKLRELADEFRLVFAGRGNLIDSVVPTVVFVIVNAAADLKYAAWAALGLAAAFTAWRLSRRQPIRYAVGGLGAVAAATAVAGLLDRAEGYFLPGVLSGALTGTACGLSVVLKRPLVAWTSHLVRRWPRGWYWHPRIRPAYSEVTLAWMLFFAARVWLQLSLLRETRTAVLGTVNLIAGWPATVLLLASSYLYGTWRLRSLGGPSVDEFVADAGPPWRGQRRGF